MSGRNSNASGGPTNASGTGANMSSQTGTQGSSSSQQNLNQIVIDYLNKKGYTQTESMLRREMGNVDAQGRVIYARAEDRGASKYIVAYTLLHEWIEENLEVYKIELKRLLWPIFVYSFLNLILESQPDLAKRFFEERRTEFAREHEVDLRALGFLSHPEHIEANKTARAYRDNQYRLSLVESTYFTMIAFLEREERKGGSVILSLLQNHMYIVPVDRALTTDKSFAAIIAKQGLVSSLPDEDEGIPGHNPGSSNTDRNAPAVLTKLNLGPLPMDSDLKEDVRGDLEDMDEADPPKGGQASLVDELDRKIKREETEETPNRDNVPLPVPLARDVAMDVSKIKEYRDRFQISPRSGGVGPGVSVMMITYHNTFDSVNCIAFSGDTLLVAAGMAESYIRVWSLDGKALPSTIPAHNTRPVASRRLYGHSGPVYNISFSPSTPKPDDDPDGADTRSRYLLSASSDKTVRLWCLQTWSCLVLYKGHDLPVWDVKWGPFGHYFLTGSRDHTARLWTTDNIAPLRIFAGHDQDVDVVAWHPNNAYVFTGSSDKTVRMWDVSRGSAVRIFTGHTGNITALSCSPSGRSLVSADDQGAILLWDLELGRRVKQMRGHGRGGIWSLAWSVESTVVISGGADCTVRVWDVLQQTEGTASGAKAATDGNTSTTGKGGESAAAASSSGTASSGVPIGKKGAKKDATVTADQISVFPTKKSPVYQVKFTNMNCGMAAGLFLP